MGYKGLQFPLEVIPEQDIENIDIQDIQVKLDLDARLFWEDLPYGLVVLKDIGRIIGVDTPAVTKNIVFL